jgi:hypothetical protein
MIQTTRMSIRWPFFCGLRLFTCRSTIFFGSLGKSVCDQQSTEFPFRSGDTPFLGPQPCVDDQISSEERLQQFEAIFVRFLHLLAHHPDFSKDVEDVKLFAKCVEIHQPIVIYRPADDGPPSRYIEFYLDCVANMENISFLFHLASKLKTVRDSESQGHSEARFFVLSLKSALKDDSNSSGGLPESISAL